MHKENKGDQLRGYLVAHTKHSDFSIRLEAMRSSWVWYVSLSFTDLVLLIDWILSLNNKQKSWINPSVGWTTGWENCFD